VATIRERGDGVYEVRVFVGRDERGKPSQRSKTVRGGKREAERVAAELETKPFRAGAKTVADALDAWVEMKTPTWAVSSKRDQIGRANALKEDPIGNVSVARLGVEDVDKWIARRRKQGKGEPSATSSRSSVPRCARLSGGDGSPTTPQPRPSSSDRSGSSAA